MSLVAEAINFVLNNFLIIIVLGNAYTFLEMKCQLKSYNLTTSISFI